MTIALIDADIISFSCAAYCDSWGGDWEACKVDIDNLVRRILENVGATSYEMYITGENNFRYAVYPEYKANRRTKPSPRYRTEANEYLVVQYGARVTDGCEADDLLGIRQSTQDGTVICTIDKDLDQIAGPHYNWRKDIHYDVSPVDAVRSLYRSSLIGDTADHIRGVDRIGPVKAARYINDLESEADMFRVCKALYNDDQRFLMNMKCLYIWRKENDDYQEIYERLNAETEEEE